MGNKKSVSKDISHSPMEYSMLDKTGGSRSQTPRSEPPTFDFSSASTERNENRTRTICIVGSGLAGSMMAILLAKLGFNVCIYEKRQKEYSEEDKDVDEVKVYGASKSAQKRSINLALSYRGMIALREIGMLDEVMVDAIRMPCRVIHNIGKAHTTQAYGKVDEALYSVGRQFINSLLQDRIEQSGSNIKMFFGHSFVKSDKDGTCSFRNERTKEVITERYDLVIGSDGAYSSVRENLLRQGRINYSRQYIAHGYKELSIPPIMDANGNPTFALENPGGLHIWPRGSFMLIALPNPDKSFTATLFAPYEGEDGFDSIDSNSQEQVESYFNRHFPDVFPLIQSTLFEDYRDNPVGSLVTIRTSPWNFGKTVLLGDAAHAVVPFYGQGMNAAFEDTSILYEIIKEAMLKTPHLATTAPLPPLSGSTDYTATATKGAAVCASADAGDGDNSSLDSTQSADVEIDITSSQPQRKNSGSGSSGSSSGGQDAVSIGSDDSNDVDYVISPLTLSVKETAKDPSILAGDIASLSTSTSSHYTCDYTNAQLNAVDLMACIGEFARVRQPSANALSDLCLEHYHDMASNTANCFYLIKKRVELLISTLLPSAFMPLYSMISFSNTPYHEAVLIAERQEKVLTQVSMGIATVAAVATGGMLYVGGMMMIRERR